MSLKRTVTSAAAAALLALSVATGAIAQDNQITQVIEGVDGGELTASLTTMSDFEALPYSTQQRTNDAAMTLRVDDKRGTAEGWRITIQASDFVYDGDAPPPNPQDPESSHDISAANLKVLQLSQPVPIEGTSDTNGIAHRGQGSTLNNATEVLVASANHGNGSYTLGIPVQLTIPGASPVGSYTSTVTVNSYSGPNGN